MTMNKKLTLLRLPPLLPLLIAAFALLPMPADAALGDHQSALDFTVNPVTGATPRSIAYDGRNFGYVTSRGSSNRACYSGRAFKLVNNSGVEQGSISSLCTQPSGIAFDGTHYHLMTYYPTSYRSYGCFIQRYDTTPTFVDQTKISSTSCGTSLTFDGVNLRHLSDNTVTTYTTGHSHITDNDFNVAMAVMGNNNSIKAHGIAWDGSYLRIVRGGSHDDILALTSDGAYVATQDIDLVSANNDARDIAWDGSYLRVLDSIDDKVYTYEGATVSTNPHGLPDDADHYASLDSSVSAHGGWKCISSSAGETVSVNNSTLKIHGFCARDNVSGMDVEIHVAPTTPYWIFDQFALQTGEWWFVETGATATANLRIYSDVADTDGNIAFSEETGGLAASTRLGFSTLAKSVTDDDCAEGEAGEAGEGFACSQSYLTGLTTSDSGVLLFALAEENTLDFAPTPSTPDQITISRNADYTTSTIAWSLYGPVAAYQVNRLAAVQVDVDDASRIEYGDPVTFNITGTQAGVSVYEDATISASTTYQYRIRARGAGLDSWSSWSSYIFSGSKPAANIRAPGNIRFARDSSSVTILWDAPPTGSFSHYTVQRQELISSGGSTFFGNITTLSPTGATWITGASDSFVDNLTRLDQIYEYRVAAVEDDHAGNYSEWFRSAPTVTNMGAAPAGFRLDSERGEVFDSRREFWFGWAPVTSADDYQLLLHTYDVTTRTRKMWSKVVTDTSYFGTAYATTEIQVRGRKLDADLCSDQEDEYCTTEWSGWRRVEFAPRASIPTPELTDDSTDDSIMQFRENLSEVFNVFLREIGSPTDASLILQFLPIFASFIVTGIGFTIAAKRGQPALGAGLGCAATVMGLFLGSRLLGTPLAFGLALQGIVLIGGLTGLVRQSGVWR